MAQWFEPVELCVKLFGTWDYHEKQRQKKKENGNATKMCMKVKTLADAIQVKTTTTIHNSQIYTLIFTLHWLEVYGNKDKVYYVKQVKRVELQKHPLHDVKF